MSESPLFLVCGTDEYRRRKFIRGMVAKQRSMGWTAQFMDGTDHESLDGLLGSSGVLFDGMTLCVITHPEKLPEKLVAAHAKDPDPTVVMLLVYETDTPKGAVAELVPKEKVKEFPLPAFYKMEDHAVASAREDARASGFILDKDLATSLVRTVGQDQGVLSFEISKAVALARATGVVGTITRDVVRGSVASLAESDGSMVVKALAAKNARALATELGRFKQSKGGDPTIEMCGRVLSPTILKWLQAAHLYEHGVSAQAGAGRVGANPWYWERVVLPPAASWGVRGCKRLLKAVASAQTAVFTGAVNPWVVLESGLLGAFSA